MSLRNSINESLAGGVSLGGSGGYNAVSSQFHNVRHNSNCYTKFQCCSSYSFKNGQDRPKFNNNNRHKLLTSLKKTV